MAPVGLRSLAVFFDDCLFTLLTTALGSTHLVVCGDRLFWLYTFFPTRVLMELSLSVTLCTELGSPRPAVHCLLTVV